MSNAKLLYTSFIAINLSAMTPIIYQLSTDSSDFSETVFLLPALVGALLISAYAFIKDKSGHPLTRAKASTVSAISIAIVFEFLTSRSNNPYIYIGDLVEFIFKNTSGNVKDALTNPDLYQTALPTIAVAAFLYFVYHSIKGALELVK